MQKSPPTPKGFRDISPELAGKRRRIINQIVEILEDFGFVPIETPTIEFAQTLKGKYGEEERLIYEFKDRGGRELALRYDLTVPLARFVATNSSLPMPFRRYQIGQVFRGENPQAGRYREFTQLDFDTIGSESLEEDAKIIACTQKTIKSVGLASAQMLINDRKNFSSIPTEVVQSFDKIQKIGQKGVEAELKKKGLTISEVKDFTEKIIHSEPTVDLVEIFERLIIDYKLVKGKDFIFDPTLARGLDYYTGSIFELKPTDDPASLSIGSGGRYDNLIGMFSRNSASRRIPAVGFSFGIDRLIESLK